jgi:hypothetical protein
MEEVDVAKVLWHSSGASNDVEIILYFLQSMEFSMIKKPIVKILEILL